MATKPTRQQDLELEPIATLLLGDDDFRALVEKAEAELGEV